MSAPDRKPSEFLSDSAQERPSFVTEYLAFLRQTRKWWMLPVIVLLLLFGLLVVLSATGAAPFIYTLF